ncbi:MAG: glycosyltransferase family 2 protein [Acidobacteriota bacterium]
MKPLVSVVMPVRNEGTYIERSLGSVLHQSYRPLEVLLVDGSSTDDTRGRARALAARHPDVAFEIVDNPERTAPFALNRGIRAARGEFLVRVDGHCEIGPEYVTNGVAHLERGTGDGVGGVLDTVGETVVARAIAGAMSSRFGVGGSGFRTARGDFEPRLVDTVAFPAYRRETVLSVGGFDEELKRNQDDEFNFRLRRAGLRIALVGDMPSRYYSRATLRRLLKQYLQYGFYKVRVLQKHPRQMSARQFAPALLVLALFATTAWAIASPILALIPLLTLAGLYAFLLLVGTALNAPRLGAGATPIFPLACALLHFGYGVGSIAGLVRFAGRWGDREGSPGALGTWAERQSQDDARPREETGSAS